MLLLVSTTKFSTEHEHKNLHPHVIKSDSRALWNALKAYSQSLNKTATDVDDAF